MSITLWARSWLHNQCCTNAGKGNVAYIGAFFTAVTQSVWRPSPSIILPTHFMQAGSFDRLGRLLAGMIST